MPSKLVYLLQAAYAPQSGHRYCCDFHIGENDSVSSARSHDITTADARSFQSTAEHLEAEKGSEKNTQPNIVAACLLCNSKRHRKGTPRPNRIDWFRRNAILLKRTRE